MYVQSGGVQTNLDEKRTYSDSEVFCIVDDLLTQITL